MLKLAVAGDLHYPAEVEGELARARDALYAAYLKLFLEAEADFHVAIGDITHAGLAEEFAAVKRLSRGQPGEFRPILGNHDVLAYPKDKLVELTGLPRFQAVETDDALLLFLDTNKELELHGWGLDEEQWEWLAIQTARAPDKAMAVFAHHPVPGTTADSPPSAGSFGPYQDMRPLLDERSGPGLYCSGHTHTHAIHAEGNWLYVQTAAVPSDPAYRLIEIDSGEIRVETIRLQDEGLLRCARVLHERLPGYHRPPQNGVRPSDLSRTFRFG